MPELPEVETIRKILKKNVKGKKITNCFVFFNKIIRYPSLYEFISKIIFQKINDIKRMGKYLLFVLDNDILISHLRMEGKYFFYEKNFDYMNLKHIMIVFEIDSKYYLIYCDIRKFGTMHLYPKNKYLINSPLSRLGLEPFDMNVTVEYLQENWKNKKKFIKSILLEQSVISGIGNIYADEILFMSNINPYEKVKNFSRKNYYDIINNARKILKLAIDNGGTTVSTYYPEPRSYWKFCLSFKSIWSR